MPVGLPGFCHQISRRCFGSFGNRIEAPTLVPPTSTSSNVTLRESNTMASLRLLESFANGPLHATMREAAIAAFDFAVAAAGDAPVAGCLAGAWPGAPPGAATAPGIGCAICDGESWSSALRLESGADWRCCADSELAKIMAKPATSAAPIRYFRISDSLDNPRPT